MRQDAVLPAVWRSSAVPLAASTVNALALLDHGPDAHVSANVDEPLFFWTGEELSIRSSHNESKCATNLQCTFRIPKHALGPEKISCKADLTMERHLQGEKMGKIEFLATATCKMIQHVENIIPERCDNRLYSSSASHSSVIGNRSLRSKTWTMQV